MKLLRTTLWYLDFLRQMTPRVGFWGALTLQLAANWNRHIAEPFCPRLKIRGIRLTPAGYGASMSLRPNSSDFKVFEQIFFFEHYKAATQIQEAEVIVDCGANAGYSALFFLKHFPHARVIAVEPDADNAELCRRNLRPYRDRSIVLQKAIWGNVGKLGFAEDTRYPGEEWGIQVREAIPTASGETIEALDIPTLMTMAGVQHIDLLKIDIERSEIDVFQSNPEAWLDRINNIAIELHGSDCSEVFHSAMSHYSFEEMECGDVTLCLGVRPRANIPPHIERVDTCN